MQMQALLQDMADFQLTKNSHIWRYNRGVNFSSSEAYKPLVGHAQIHIVYQDYGDASVSVSKKCFTGS